jgi:hypothetical protein
MRGRGELLLRSVVEAETGQVGRPGALAAALPAEGATPVPGPFIPRDGRSLAAPRPFVPGPHHHLSTKHLRAYLDEHRWRFAHRGNPHVFRDTIVALLGGERMRYVELVGGRWR